MTAAWTSALPVAPSPGKLSPACSLVPGRTLAEQLMPDPQPHLKLSQRQASWAAAGAGSAPCGSALPVECQGQGSACCAALGAPRPGVLGRGGPSAWRAERGLGSCQQGAEAASAPWLGGAAWQGKPAQTMPSWGCRGVSLQPLLSCLETTATFPASCHRVALQGGAWSVTITLARSACPL